MSTTDNSKRTIFYKSPEIWNKIDAICALPANIKVASPFISDKVKFNWKNGDSLLVALTEQNVRKGYVNPFAIEEVIKEGVSVYSNENLHAKIYTNGEKAIVCSCNLSQASQSKWVEAGVSVSDSESLKNISDFFENNLIESHLVTSESLEYFKGIFRIDLEALSQMSDAPFFPGNVWSIDLVTSKSEEDYIEEKIKIAIARE